MQGVWIDTKNNPRKICAIGVKTMFLRELKLNQASISINGPT